MMDPTSRVSSRRSEGLPNLCNVYALLLLVIVAELLALLLVLADVGLGGFNWAQLGLVSFLLQWIVLASAGLLCLMQPILTRMNPVTAGICSYAVVLCSTAFFSLAGQWFLQGVGGQYIDWMQIFTHVIIAAILAGMLLRYLYLQQRLYRQRQAELNARIQALQARIEPHFLFNSMNTIASLISIEPELAERQVEDLSDLLRASLAEPALIPASRELALCLSYAHIEQARLGDRLQLDWHVDALPATAMLPNLLLQPLLENAIRHGIEPSSTGGWVSLKAGVEAKQLVIEVCNSLPEPYQPGAQRGNCIALANIEDRLQAHFDGVAQLTLKPDTKTFTATITIPLNAFAKAVNRQQYG
ncbi:sensor histidine kinase [Gilvimarinus chinensis]|uniref:sensor histidine kinase n=1 Tax=Gilvimarinus chinensis TaxID=396005 RepID=UPI00039FB8B4|nr:histidine kinase [Gilvimarinus chinensis]